MKGKRVYELLNELSPKEHRQLLFVCSKSEDKRLKVFFKVLRANFKTLEEFNILLQQQTELLFLRKDEEELEHTVRRNLDFYLSEIEQIIIQSYLENDSKQRNIILGEALEQGGNPFLLEYYYDKAYKDAINRDYLINFRALRGKIRLKFNSQSEREFLKSLDLNSQMKASVEEFYHEKLCDYYNNISNIYLDSYLLVKIDELGLTTEIDTKIKECGTVNCIVNYRIAQARLNFKTPSYEFYINQVHELLNNSEIDKFSKDVLKRKVYFLELIMGFYLGKRERNLMELTNSILEISKRNRFVDNNTMFHKLLLLIIDDKLEDVHLILSTERNYFKGKTKELKEFKVAFIAFRKNQIAKCLKTINQLSYSTNYFIALFSRMLSIKIHIGLNNEDLAESLIYNTERFVKKNSDKYTVFNSSLSLLHYFKKRTYRKNPNMSQSIQIMSPYFGFLMQE